MFLFVVSQFSSPYIYERVMHSIFFCRGWITGFFVGGRRKRTWVNACLLSNKVFLFRFPVNLLLQLTPLAFLSLFVFHSDCYPFISADILRSTTDLAGNIDFRSDNRLFRLDQLMVVLKSVKNETKQTFDMYVAIFKIFITID